MYCAINEKIIWNVSIEFNLILISALHDSLIVINITHTFRV